MRLLSVVLFFYLSVTINGKTIKKTNSLNKKPIGKTKPLPPAIIAIEIVDPKENKTSKNSKRTIGSSLGYGYQSPPKYQVYKYSQRDIPPYRGHSSGGHQYNFQKSVSYNLPTQVYKTKNLNQYYQPGTTLYSMVNSQGQVGSLSSHLPQQTYHENEPQVPVIILRVYPSQLTDPSAVLHPNLPQSHPLAAAVNSIDIQSLLAKYVQNLLLQQQHYQPVPQYHYQPQPQYQYVAQPHYHQPDDGLLTHENYPKETHTRVIFRTDKNKAHNPHQETKTIQIALPPNVYSAVQVETPHMQYSYTNQKDDQSHYYQQEQPQQQDQNYYYQSEQEYQQPEQQYEQPQQQYEQPEQYIQDEAPHNYHSHQKRNKKSRISREGLQDHKDVIKLQPIRA